MANISERGELVISLKGHDKGEVLVIIQADGGDYVLVANGKTRSVLKPKRKKIKHLRALNAKIDLDVFYGNGGLTDGDLKKAIEANLNKIGG